MKNLVAKVRSQRLFGTGETVVVAVSGGADSVALLDLLTQLDAEQLNLVVAHLNHGLRGAESDGDENFVAALAEGYGLTFVAKRVDVAAFAAKERLSLEDAGRKARYAFFDESARAHGATSIALAHHQDDQAETVLIRLLRGSGGSGLSAMASSAQKLRRPLLQVSRAEIERYLKLRGITWRTDATNADTAILRNSIRHELIPLLRRYNPKVSQRLAATAEILASDEELLEQLTSAAYQRLADCHGAAIAFSTEPLLREPRALRLRLYRRALQELRGDLMRIGTAHLEAIDRLAASTRPNARAKLPGACFVSRCYDTLNFARSDLPAGVAWEHVVAGEGEHPLPRGGRLTVQRIPRPHQPETASRLVAYLSPEAAPFPWLLRSFAPGDRFIPLGMTGAQKIKDLFINEKIPPLMRSRIPLLVSGGEIIWVPGVRMGEKARITAATGAVLRVEILEITP